MEREPAEQRACPPALGHRQRDSVRLEREGAEQAHAEHGDKAIRGQSRAFAFVWRSLWRSGVSVASQTTSRR